MCGLPDALYVRSSVLSGVCVCVCVCMCVKERERDTLTLRKLQPRREARRRKTTFQICLSEDEGAEISIG